MVDQAHRIIIVFGEAQYASIMGGIFFIASGLVKVHNRTRYCARITKMRGKCGKLIENEQHISIKVMLLFIYRHSEKALQDSDNILKEQLTV